MTADHKAGLTLEAAKHHTDPKAGQNRAGCCGTMQHADFNGDAEAVEEEIEAFKKSFHSSSKGGRSVVPASGEEEHATGKKTRH